MEHAPSAPVDPAGADAQRTQAVVIRGNMSPAAGSADADRGRVLAEQQRGAGTVPGFVDNPPLQRQDFLKVDYSEEEDLQGEGTGG